MDTLMQILARIPIVIIALFVREVARGYTAYSLGDISAKHDGRLSLKIMDHIDPMGVLCMVLFRFGWGKGHSIDTRYLKNPRRDVAIITLAGPMSNFVLAFIFMLILYPTLRTNSNSVFVQLITLLATEGVMLNLSFAVFTLIPIPPLDGFTILGGILPLKYYVKGMEYSRYGFFVVLILIYTGIISRLLSPVIVALMMGLFEIASMIFFFL